METDVSMRAVRYALTVADHSSLTHAAASLYLSQQALSQHIRRLERDLGFALFDRLPHGVRPTAAGAIWFEGARAALIGLRQARDTARDAARADGRTHVRMGYVPGAAIELTQPLLDHLAAALPSVDIHLHEAPLHDTTAGLATGEVDVAVLRAPLTDTDLHCIELLAEPRVVVLPDGHPLTGQDTVHPEQLTRAPLIGLPGTDPIATGFWILRDVLGDHAPTAARTATSLSEEMQLVARGSLLSVTALSATRYFSWPGVTARLLDDCPPSRVIAARRNDDPRAAPSDILAIAAAFVAARRNNTEDQNLRSTRRPNQ